MRCKDCGWDNPAGSKSCEKCGEALNGIDNSAHQTVRQNSPEGFNPRSTMKGCPKCGYQIGNSGTECPNCGYDLREASRYIKEPEETEENNGGSKNAKKTIIYPFPPDAGAPPVDPGKKLAGFLVTYSHSANGDFFPLYEGRNTIGRSPSNDIVIPDMAVSGDHLTIAYYSQDKKFYFEAVGLTQNGTCVNGKFFPKGGDELLNYDVVVIGSTRLTFIAIPETAKTPSAT